MHELYVDSNGNEAKYPGFYRKSLEKIKNAAVNVVYHLYRKKHRGLHGVRVCHLASIYISLL